MGDTVRLSWKSSRSWATMRSMASRNLPERVDQLILNGYKINMVDLDLEALYPKVRYAFVSHGESLDLRRRLFELARSIGYDLPALVSPNASVSAYSQLGCGTLAMHHVVVNASSKIGANVILNTGAIVEHDSQIGDHSHIAPGAVLCGRVRVGEMTLVGANSVIIPGVHVGHNVVLGAGSVVIRDIPDNVSMAGNPCAGHSGQTLRTEALNAVHSCIRA